MVNCCQKYLHLCTMPTTIITVFYVAFLLAIYLFCAHTVWHKNFKEKSWIVKLLYVRAPSHHIIFYCLKHCHKKPSSCGSLLAKVCHLRFPCLFCNRSCTVSCIVRNFKVFTEFALSLNFRCPKLKEYSK